MKWVAVFILVVLVAPALGQGHDLYVNRDGKAFVLERTFPSLAECDRVARALYESKRALGAGCKVAPPPPGTIAPSPSGEFGRRFIESQQEARQEAQDAARERAWLRVEQDRVRAEERKARALEDLGRWRR